MGSVFLFSVSLKTVMCLKIDSVVKLVRYNTISDFLGDFVFQMYFQVSVYNIKTRYLSFSKSFVYRRKLLFIVSEIIHS